MADGGYIEVMEGFLCPICKADLGTAAKLLSHFQDEHSEEQDLLKSFKELFGKAKKKILKNDQDIDYIVNQRQSSPSKVFVYEKQEMGAAKSHYSYFESIRSARIQRFHIPVNQIIIRLEKLLLNMPHDPVKKKAHEQKVVPWVDGTAVTRCPTCTRSFHLTRRQHHCRLCGTILCQDCSSFISIRTAWGLLEKQNVPSEDGNEMETLRICQICLGLLESRQRRQKDSAQPKTIISQLYDKLSEYQRQAEQESTTFLKMYKSLCEGETFHNLDDAQSLRVNIIHLAENIDRLSAAIGALGTKEGQNPPNPQALTLQKAIRTGAIAYLRTHLLSIPVLPTEDELKRMIENRRQEALLAKRQEEKLQNYENQHLQNRTTNQKKNTSVDYDKGFSVGQGWVPPTNMQHFSCDDPLLQQINIIQSYIKEARNANRDEEVASLEANLDELRQEYWRNLQQQEEKSEVSVSSSDVSEIN